LAFGYPDEISPHALPAQLYKALQGIGAGFENACNQQYMQGKIRDSCT
jgi:hypothetical protein